MQRSHWHLMLRHSCPKLVSGNSTVTAISMHCIVRSLKLWRALWHGYTPPKRWSRLVKITCGLHCMWPKKCSDLLWGNPRCEQLIGSVRSPVCKIWIWQQHSSEHLSVMAGPKWHFMGLPEVQCTRWLQAKAMPHGIRHHQPALDRCTM